ncbi:MAG TPA: lactate racemase domain-containing protein [Gaiellaceae bacterium]|nr:lactate racemase domain-containing protein [Gaiellaceae bacterium]
MQRVPLLAGPRVQVAQVPPGAVVLHPPPPAAPIADVTGAVVESLRFPLDGPPVAELLPPGGRVTIVIEPPALPIPGSPGDPRQEAIAATVAELERSGVPLERQTILVAGGLQRRAAPREIGHLVAPEFRRRFRGRLVVHDVEHEDLVEVAPGLRVNPALVEADAVVVVTAAETVRHGGPAALLAAAGVEASRGGGPASLLEPATSPLWARGVELERALRTRVPLFGVSLALNNPLSTGALRGYPHDEEAVERIASSVAVRGLSLVPGPLRRAALTRLRLEPSAFAVLGGTPSAAHAEALLRATELRAARLDAPLDAIVVGIPPTTPTIPRERPNPISVAYLGLGLALRLWRGGQPLVEGGTVILLHHLRRSFAVPTQHPYRQLFRDEQFARDAAGLEEATRAAAADTRAIEEYRLGRACHPLLPVAEWEACVPTIERAGTVLVAGCRDAVAARQLGFVPTHGLGPALEMAQGRAGGGARIGFLLAPPYFPLLAGD